MGWVLLAGAVVVAAFAVGWLLGRRVLGGATDAAALGDVEAQFVERMRGVTLVGRFTAAGEDARSPNPERYDIASVEKVGPDQWRFNATLQCCGINGTIPVVVPMRWIGDTPVIMMTDTSVPGLGTFTVRVCFYGDSYTGIWQHGERSGHMAGRIVRRRAEAVAVKPEAVARSL